MNAIQRACDAVGGVGKLAALVGVAPPTVTQWCRGARPVPPRKAVRIESATAGQVTRRDIFPDDWHEIWPELATTNPTTEPAAAGV
jgi:DNA-binding transcriptional regulator YdaS (Cro superfamily)